MIIKRTVVILISILFFLAALEAGLRIAREINPLAQFLPRDYNRHRPAPGTSEFGFVLNSRGFKDREFTIEKGPGTFRILAIGDSIHFSVVPYDKSSLFLLEEKLNRKQGGFEVINMGIPSISPRDFLSMLINEGVALKPDMVLLTFCTEDDFYKKPFKHMIHSSCVYNLAKSLFADDLWKKNPVQSALTVYRDSAPTFSDDTFMEIKKKRIDIYLKDNKRFASDAARTVQYHRSIKKICDYLGIPCAILIGPEEIQVDRSLQKKVAAATGKDVEAFDFFQPNRLLKKHFTSMGIHSIELVHTFIEISRKENITLFKPNDTHWNLAGNRVAAEVLYRKISVIIRRTGSE